MYLFGRLRIAMRASKVGSSADKRCELYVQAEIKISLRSARLDARKTCRCVANTVVFDRCRSNVYCRSISEVAWIKEV